MDVTLWTTVCGSVRGMDWLTGLGEVWSSLFGENERRKMRTGMEGERAVARPLIRRPIA